MTIKTPETKDFNLLAEHDAVGDSSTVEIINERGRDRRYSQYWCDFSRLAGSAGDEAEQGWRNFRDQRKLEQALYEPKPVQLGRKTIEAVDIAEEWYLRQGSLNHMNGAERPLATCFVRLWDAARGNKTPIDDINIAFRQASIEIYSAKGNSDGVPSELIRLMAGDSEKAHKAVLAGNVMLDFVRSTPPEKRDNSHLLYLGLVELLNAELATGLSDMSNLSSEQKRVMSDALKFKYEARFEALTTQWQMSKIDDETYQARFNLYLGAQADEIHKTASKNGDGLTNGDLNEHYFALLLKYGVTGWKDETRFIVQAATRRQDEPHDGFAPRRLPVFSFDAMVRDVSAEIPDQFVQLKAGLTGSGNNYAEGITEINDIIIDGDGGYIRSQILTGITQLRGLLRELNTGQHYAGSTDVVTDHIRAIERRMELFVRQ